MAADDLKNVHASVMRYVASNLEAVAKVEYPGGPELSKESLTEWFQVTLQGPVAAPTRRGERHEVWLLTCSAFTRTGEGVNGTPQSGMYRHLEMAGEFRDLFNQYDLAVQDWDAMGDPEVGRLRFAEVDVTPVHDVRETSLQQAAATVDGVLIL